MSENILEPRHIAEILEKTFYVDSYQRGYRWGKTEVLALLNDINDFSIKTKSKDETYWLQPIIVKQVEKVIDDKAISCYELIDGQQRLSTIFLIFSFIKKKTPFSIIYNTRTGSSDFLNKISEFDNQTWDESYGNTKDDKIDNFHFFTAYKIIQQWFGLYNDAEKFLDTLLNNTNVIWYELVGDTSDPKTVFEQINIGKIPLTNAELVKALYLNNSVQKIHRDEIADKWDRIEYALNDDAFWGFINNKTDQTHNRIEYLLDLISGKFDNENNKEEKFHTFLHFYAEQDRYSKWKTIEEYFQTLLGWYETPELFHYVGYLISTEFSTINSIIKKYNSKLDKPKSVFINDIINLIKEKLKNYSLEDLSYKKPSDYKKIVQILLLFNIQTTLNTTPYNYFPFHKYKSKEWSLEHIHAQQSESLTDYDAIIAWIKETKPAIKNFLNDTKKGIEANQLLEDFDAALRLGKNINIGELPKRVFNFFGGDDESVHSISNMALLDKDTNSSLNNSVFPIKRNKIFSAEIDSKVYIPICTKNVFLKYYSSNISHMQFWSESDRVDYLKAIDKCIKPFLS